MPNALLLADDLTGTLDSGHGFATRGRGVSVRLLGGDTRSRYDRGSASEDVNADVDADPDVLAIDTDSRGADADAASRIVGSVVACVDAAVLYKKIDSTLRGNVAAEVETALDESDRAAAVVAPAFPETGRTTRDGVHRVTGAPLADAGYSVDESSIPALFSGSERPVEHLGLATVDAGAEAVVGALETAVRSTDRSPIVTCDAATDEHLAAIAAGSGSFDEPVLHVGSAGLAAHVAVPGEPEAPSPPSPSGRGVLAVVGSVNPRTLDQLDMCSDGDVIRIDPAAAVRDPAAVARSTAPTAIRRTRERGRAILTAAVDATDVHRAEAAAGRLSETRGDDYDAGKRIADALAGTARRALTGGEAADPAWLFLTGGDVARGTLDALAVTTIRLTGQAVEAGLPVSWIADGPAAGTRLVTKAGGFGDEKAIVNFLRGVSVGHE